MEVDSSGALAVDSSTSASLGMDSSTSASLGMDSSTSAVLGMDSSTSAALGMDSSTSASLGMDSSTSAALGMDSSTSAALGMDSSTNAALGWAWNLTIRRRRLDDTFFEDGNTMCRLGYVKQTAIQPEDQSNLSEARLSSFPCQIAHCKAEFKDLSSYELHYRTAHSHVCRACHRPFPTDHLLDLHIHEWHDTMFSLLALKHSMFRCLVETCCEKFFTSKLRQDHLVKVHKYPANFRFHRPNKKGKNQSKSKEEVKTTVCSGSVSATPESSQGQASDQAIQMEMETMCTAGASGDQGPQGQKQSNLGSHVSESGRRFVYSVPKNFSFGHGVSRGFQPKPGGKKKKKQSKGWHQMNKNPEEKTEVDIRDVHMNDLADALE